MLLQREDLGQLVEILQTRNLFLYHACPLRDFQVYCAIGGIPSRELLERHPEYTHFISDNQDRASGVWDKVFGNLADFGEGFARRKEGATCTIPNPYGPIVLKIHPRVLLEANDLSIALRSAFVKGFDREAEGLCVDQIARCFREFGGLWYPSFTKQIQEELCLDPDLVRSSPEFSATMPDGMIAMTYVVAAIVEPLQLSNGSTLLGFAKSTPKRPAIWSRTYRNPEQLARYNHVARAMEGLNGADGRIVLRDFLPLIADGDTHAYFESVDSNERLRWNCESWLTYLRDGTVSKLFPPPDATADPLHELPS